MKKIITIIIVVLIILAAGGWYFYSQQDIGQEQAKKLEDVDTPKREDATPAKEDVSEDKSEEKDTKEKEAKADEDNPYLEAKEVPAIAGPNEKIHEISERILTSVFDEVKLTDTNSDSDPGDPKFDYVANYDYIVLEEIDMDQAGQIREAILEEGGEINSTDVDSDSYRYWYDFEMGGEEYSANMGIFVGGEHELGDKPQTIEIDIHLNS